MKRIGLHLAFWSVYFVQDVLLIFCVNITRLQKPAMHDLALAAANCLVLLVPKILFTYFIFQVALEKIGSKPQQARGVFTAIIALLGTILLYRVLAIYIINPYIYHWNSDQALLYPLALLVALMDIGFVSGAAIVIRQVRAQAADKEREKMLVSEKLEAEIKYLRNQVNPHFLFNTLNNIYALARKKSDQAPEVVLKLSKLLRFMLYESGRPWILISEELKFLDDYIELERLRYDSRLSINFYREIDNMQEEISPLLLLPFVENAFKHGPGESHFNAYIHMELILQNGWLTFNIENTKETVTTNGTGESIGLRNVRRQLELMYPGYSMQVYNEEALYKVSLSVHLQKHEKDQLSYIGR